MDDKDTKEEHVQNSLDEMNDEASPKMSRASPLDSCQNSEIPIRPPSSAQKRPRPVADTAVSPPSSASSESTPRQESHDDKDKETANVDDEYVFDDDDMIVFDSRPLVLAMTTLLVLHGLGGLVSRLLPTLPWSPESLTTLSWLLVASGPMRTFVNQWIHGDDKTRIHPSRRERQRTGRLFLSACLLALTAVLYQATTLSWPQDDVILSEDDKSQSTSLLLPWILQALIACAVVLPHAMAMSSSSGRATQWSLVVGTGTSLLGLLLYLITLYQLRQQTMQWHSFCCIDGLFAYAQRPNDSALILVVTGLAVLQSPALIDPHDYDSSWQPSNTSDNLQMRIRGMFEYIVNHSRRWSLAYWRVAAMLIGGPIIVAWLLKHQHSQQPASTSYKLDLVATAYLDKVPLFLFYFPWIPFDPEPYQRMEAMGLAHVPRDELKRHATKGIWNVILMDTSLVGLAENYHHGNDHGAERLLEPRLQRPRQRRRQRVRPHHNSDDAANDDAQRSGPANGRGMASDTVPSQISRIANDINADKSRAIPVGEEQSGNQGRAVTGSHTILHQGAIRAESLDKKLDDEAQQFSANKKQHVKMTDLRTRGQVLSKPSESAMEMSQATKAAIDYTSDVGLEMTDSGVRNSASSSDILDRGDQGTQLSRGMQPVTKLPTTKTRQPLSDAALRQLACINRMAAALDVDSTVPDGMFAELNHIFTRLVSAAPTLPGIATSAKESLPRKDWSIAQRDRCLTLWKGFTLHLRGIVKTFRLLDSVRVDRLYDLSALDLEKHFAGEGNGESIQSLFAAFNRLHKIEAPRFERHNDLWLLDFDDLHSC